MLSLSIIVNSITQHSIIIELESHFSGWMKINSFSLKTYVANYKCLCCLFCIQIILFVNTVYCQASDIRSTKSQNLGVSSLTVSFAQSMAGRCWVENEAVVHSNLLPTYVWLILDVSRYLHTSLVNAAYRSSLRAELHDFLLSRCFKSF